MEIKFEKELNEEKRWLKKWLILYRCTMSGFLRLKISEKIFAIKKRIKELEDGRNKIQQKLQKTS